MTTTGFDGLVAATERGAWDEVREQARALSDGLAPTADAVVREVLGRLDAAAEGDALVPLLTSLGDLVDAHGWEAGAERIDRQRLVLCEVRFAEAELGGEAVPVAVRRDLADALVSVATRADPASGDALRTAWFARALDVLAPLPGPGGDRARAAVHLAGGDVADDAGLPRDAIVHYRAAAGLLQPHGDDRMLHVVLGRLWRVLWRHDLDLGAVLQEAVRVGRAVVAAPDADLEAVEELADHLLVLWERAAPGERAPLADEIVALRRRVAQAVPSEAAAMALQQALALTGAAPDADA
ncbi:MAG: hypothetical protein R3F59_04500 [Myxococcota bacterium]